jgi:hypothetical protein
MAAPLDPIEALKTFVMALVVAKIDSTVDYKSFWTGIFVVIGCIGASYYWQKRFLFVDFVINFLYTIRSFDRVTNEMGNIRQEMAEMRTAMARIQYNQDTIKNVVKLANGQSVTISGEGEEVQAGRLKLIVEPKLN